MKFKVGLLVNQGYIAKSTFDAHSVATVQPYNYGYRCY